MNETAWIFTGIFAYGVGHAIAWFFRDMRKNYARWGFILSYFIFPVVFVFLFIGAQAIAGLQSVIISAIFALGFVIRMVRKNV